jgi:hypothetical protein
MSLLVVLTEPICVVTVLDLRLLKRFSNRHAADQGKNGDENRLQKLKPISLRQLSTATHRDAVRYFAGTRQCNLGLDRYFFRPPEFSPAESRCSAQHECPAQPMHPRLLLIDRLSLPVFFLNPMFPLHDLLLS